MRKANGPESVDALMGAEFERLYDRALARMRIDPEKRKALSRTTALLLELPQRKKGDCSMNEEMKRAVIDLIREALVLTIQEMGMSQEQGNIFLDKFIKNLPLATQIITEKGGKA